jgi:hypothetical protein
VGCVCLVGTRGVCPERARDSAIAILLAYYSWHRGQSFPVRGKARTLELWLPLVADAQQKANMLMSAHSTAVIRDVLSLLSAELAFAADESAR